MQSYGLKFIASLCSDPIQGLSNFLNCSVSSDLFTKGAERAVFAMVHDHTLTHGVMPALDTIELEVSKEFDIDLVVPDEPYTYWLKKMEARTRHNRLKQAVNDTADLLKANKGLSALKLLDSVVSDLNYMGQRNQIIDFKTQALPIIDADLKHKQMMGVNYGIRTGWPYMDEMSGGYVGGDYISIVGRPAQGKTYLVLFMALAMWRLYGKIPCFVSMEMHPHLIVQRLAAMATAVPQKLFKKAELGGKQKKHVYNVLEAYAASSDIPPFYVIDGNLSATPMALHGLARQLKPDCMLIDGAYLLRDSYDNRVSGWHRIKSTVEETKQRIAGEMGIPCVGSFQFNKTFKAKDAKAKPTIDDIGGSDAIAQISTMVMGLMQEDSVATLNRKRVEVLKGRSGETGSFDINWLFEQFPYMDFKQVPEESIDGDLEFI